MHLNSTTISCDTPAITDTDAEYKIYISLNGEEFEVVTIDEEEQELVFQVDITVEEIVPGLAFENEVDIEIHVYAAIIYDLDSLACKVHDLVLPATYHEDSSDGKTYASCTIPSYAYLLETAESAIGDANSVTVEISNDGEVFSDSDVKFKFLTRDQVMGVDPQFGPEEGGTVVSVEMYDLPASSLFTTSCEFPGY